jgi:hypothetical protein
METTRGGAVGIETDSVRDRPCTDSQHRKHSLILDLFDHIGTEIITIRKKTKTFKSLYFLSLTSRIQYKDIHSLMKGLSDLLKTVKGLLHLVPPRTPRSSGYGVLYTCGLCYMLFLLYV